MRMSVQTEAGPLPGALAPDRVTVSRTVLVVDDDPNLRGLIETLLRRAGYAVLLAADAATALRYLHAVPVHLVITDLSLPDMDGLAFLAWLQRDPATRTLPVMVVTAYSDPAFRAKSIARGAAGFLGKPFRNRELVDLVDQLLGVTRAA